MLEFLIDKFYSIKIILPQQIRGFNAKLHCTENQFTHKFKGKIPSLCLSVIWKVFQSQRIRKRQTLSLNNNDLVFVYIFSESSIFEIFPSETFFFHRKQWKKITKYIINHSPQKRKPKLRRKTADPKIPNQCSIFSFVFGISLFMHYFSLHNKTT